MPKNLQIDSAGIFNHFFILLAMLFYIFFFYFTIRYMNIFWINIDMIKQMLVRIKR